jgi:hypothetical protein
VGTPRWDVYSLNRIEWKVSKEFVWQVNGCYYRDGSRAFLYQNDGSQAFRYREGKPVMESPPFEHVWQAQAWAEQQPLPIPVREPRLKPHKTAWQHILEADD